MVKDYNKDYNKAGNAGRATTPRGRQNHGGEPTLAEAMEKAFHHQVRAPQVIYTSYPQRLLLAPDSQFIKVRPKNYAQHKR
jgi:hypothetical protein